MKFGRDVSESSNSLERKRFGNIIRYAKNCVQEMGMKYFFNFYEVHKVNF